MPSLIAWLTGSGCAEADANAAFIAAANPATILALVSRLAELERDRTDALRYRFLRDNPIQLRAIDGNAMWHGQMTTERSDAHTDRAIYIATLAITPEGPRHE